MFVFYGFLMLVGLVAMKVRTECGTLLSCFTPVNVAQLLPLAGGMVFFGPAGVLFVLFSNWIIFSGAFFLLPGIQLEFVEMGRRFRVAPRQIVSTSLLGVLGGLVLGGLGVSEPGVCRGRRQLQSALAVHG